MAFVDVRMPPGWDGIETIARSSKPTRSSSASICTAYSDYSWDGMIAQLGRTDRLLILKKPFDPVEVRSSRARSPRSGTRAATRRSARGVRRAEQEARAHRGRPRQGARGRRGRGARESEILGNVSHEIRTPMIAILGSADLISEEGDSAAARTKHLETIRAQGRSLLAILDDILAIAQFDTGNLSDRSRPCSPVEVVDEVLARTRPVADAKGLRLTRMPRTDPETIESDRRAAARC
jgi:signal transduction histidine kinase